MSRAVDFICYVIVLYGPKLCLTRKVMQTILPRAGNWAYRKVTP